ncbi:MAG: hypothetical protein ACRDNS_19015, partial [Trebonia sp.]
MPGGYSYLIPVPVGGFNGTPVVYQTLVKRTSGAPSLTTSNPGIGAGVDLTITNHNAVNLQGCGTAVVVTLCHDIVSADLPSIGSATITLLSASTAGNLQILPGVPGATITQSLPATIPLGGIPPFASFTIDKPDLRQNGTLAGSALTASKTSNIATFALDIDQLISNAALNPLLLPPLTGSVGPVSYSLLDANASLSGGLYQDLNFAGNTKVTLFFDHTVRARVNGVDKGAVNALEFNAGDDVKLSPIGFLRALHVVPSFSFANNMHNSTGIALSAELDAAALSASVPGLGSIGPLVQGRVDVPLGELELYHNDFAVDMKSVTGAPFDINFGLNPAALGVSVRPTLLG